MKKLIYSCNEKIDERNSRTNLEHCFEIAEQFDRLEMVFKYSPKVLTDNEKALAEVREAMKKYAPAPFDYGKAEDYLPIVNLLTLSMDCNGKYVGCLHRHDNVQHSHISENSSSYGYSKQKIELGTWQAVVNLHCVVCECEYSIEIFGERK